MTLFACYLPLTNGAVTSAIQFVVNEISYKLKRGPSKEKENYKKHDKVFEKSRTEDLGVIDASANLIAPEQGLFSDSPLSRLAAKLSIASHVTNLIGTVNLTTTDTIL